MIKELIKEAKIYPVGKKMKNRSEKTSAAAAGVELQNNQSGGILKKDFCMTY